VAWQISEADLREAAALDIGDWFRFEIGTGPLRPLAGTGVSAFPRAFCARNGWGLLVADLHRSLNDLLTMPVPEEASLQFADALRGNPKR
jgi:hypothetical protein